MILNELNRVSFRVRLLFSILNDHRSEERHKTNELERVIRNNFLSFNPFCIRLCVCVCVLFLLSLFSLLKAHVRLLRAHHHLIKGGGKIQKSGSQREKQFHKMLKLKSRAVLETPTTGLSRQLSKTGINTSNTNNDDVSTNTKSLQEQRDDGTTEADDDDDALKAVNTTNTNDENSQQRRGKGAPNPPIISQKLSIHRYPGAFGNQPRFAPSQQPPPLPFSQDFDVADYCTPADQQFELVGNIAYANTNKNSGGGGYDSQQGLQPFDSCDGKENGGVNGKGYFSSIVQNTTNGKQFGMRSPVALSPTRHKRARLGCIIDSPNVSQQMYNYNNNESSRGALDVINGTGGSSGLSGLRFQQLSSQQMQLTPRESSQPFTISRAGSLPQACLQYSQGAGGNRNSANAHNNMFEVPPIPNRQQQQQQQHQGGGGSANATKKEKLLQSPPISRNAFLRDEKQAKELPAHSRRITNNNNGSNKEAKENAQMLRFRSEFADLGLIAKGGFGKVSRVVHRLDGKMYAVKRTEKKLYGESEKNDALREVHAMAALSSLNSPNIVRYYTSWMEYDHLYIQMELCERGAVKFGPDAKFTKDEGEVLLVVRDVANALSVAHESEERIAHMDVKPDNIFESEKKIYKLGDWGRATSTCGEKRRKLIGGASEIDGDQRYLANEVLNDDFSNLAKSDVWSLGATALELLLGEALPMNGDKYRALRDGRSVNESFEDFGLSEFSCSEEMKALLKLMLAKDPESRPTAKEIMVECEKLLCLTSAMESSML